MKDRFGDTLVIEIGCTVVSAVVDFILNCGLFPIAFTMTHDI